MKSYLLVLPIAMLVTYSQLMVKWRAGFLGEPEGVGYVGRVLLFLSDPLILSAYAAALLASFAWLYVVTKLPLTVAFPVYVGATFVLVLFGGWLLLAESLTPAKIGAMTLILAGIAMGIGADG